MTTRKPPGFRLQDFDIDLDKQRAICPAGRFSVSFNPSKQDDVGWHVRFGPQCNACLFRSLCTTAKPGTKFAGLTISRVLGETAIRAGASRVPRGDEAADTDRKHDRRVNKEAWIAAQPLSRAGKSAVAGGIHGSSGEPEAPGEASRRGAPIFCAAEPGGALHLRRFFQLSPMGRPRHLLRSYGYGRAAGSPLRTRLSWRLGSPKMRQHNFT